MPQKKLDDLDDLLMDDDVKPKHKPVQRRVSTVSIGSGKPSNSASNHKNFNPRQDPNMLVMSPMCGAFTCLYMLYWYHSYQYSIYNVFCRKKPPSATSNKVSKWVSKLHTTTTRDSLPEVEHIGPLEPDVGLAQRNGSEFCKLCVECTFVCWK